MLCPTCNRDLVGMSFVNSLCHVSNCLDGRVGKVKKRGHTKKRVQRLNDWHATSDKKDESSQSKLTVTEKGQVFQSRDLLSQQEVQVRVNRIFRNSIVAKNSAANASSSSKEHVPLELSLSTSDSFTARGFEKYLSEKTNVRPSGSQDTSLRSYDSSEGGYLLDN